jgi:23S rRNA (adenine2503-C2)-methyltransferase
MYIDLSKYNLPKFRQDQINDAIFKNYANSIDSITTLPDELKEMIKADIEYPSIEEIQAIENSEVLKKIFKAKDGKTFESVLILHQKDRRTVCVSTQIGCPIGCKFCATGMLGFERNLTYQEIVDQVLHFANILKDKGEKITNIVFMGMGEPFSNTQNLVKSVKILTNPKEFNMSPRRITVSTVWTGDKILEFFKENTQINLAVSLHSPIQEKREKLIPLAIQIRIEDIQKGLKEYFKFSNRRVTLEYLMLKDVNDKDEDIQELIDFVNKLKKKLIHINLLPYNEVNNLYEPSPKDRMNYFKDTLKKNKINATIRKSMGQEIGSACGMLRRATFPPQ